MTRVDLIDIIAKALEDSSEYRHYQDNARAVLNAIGTVAAIVPREASDEICAAVGFDEPYLDYKDSYVSKEHVIADYRKAVAAADLTKADAA